MSDEVRRTIYENVTSWSFGFLVGFIACTWICRVWLRHVDHAKGTKMTGAERRDRRYTILGAIVTLLAASVIGTLVWVAENYTGGADDVWNACRHINYPLGCVVAVGVTYRLVLMALDRPRWHDPRAVHLMLWFAYIAGNLLAAALTSHHYETIGTDATWVSGFRTALMCGGLVLTIWWPHPEKYVPLEERVEERVEERAR